MKNVNFNKISPGMLFAALAVSAVCLGASLWQTHMLLETTMGKGPQAKVAILAASGILLGSQVIARLLGQSFRAKSPAWCLILGIATIGVIEGLSIGISTVSFDGNLIAATRNTNLESPEYQQIQENIGVYRRQISAIQDQIEQLDPTYVTKRQELNQTILDIQSEIMIQQRNAKEVNVASSDIAFSRLESTIGLGQRHISFILGCLLSLTPLTMNLLIGGLTWAQPDRTPTKKSQPAKKIQTRLRAVKA